MSAQKRILVVDGDDAIQDFLCLALTDEGYEVCVAADTPAALALARAFHPNLIVLDLLHPKQDGQALANTYRALLGSAVPIVAMSTDLDFPARAQTLGVETCLAKPFELGQLLDCVQQHLGVLPP
jgi:two-component system response regulator MprA